jgi:Family of unknown function (DUF5677)
MDIKKMLAEVRPQVEVLSDTLVPIVDDICAVNIGEHDNYEVVRRSIIRRQHDGLDATITLVDTKKGELAVSFLRPACEELMWLVYFKKIGARHADELVELVMVADIARTLEAQAAYTPHSMEQLGLEPWLELNRKANPKIIERLRSLGRELGWPKPRNGKQVLPSMRYIASQVGHERLYDYLYFATSKTVHFNVHELTRRVWGKSPDYNWDAPYFRDFWSLFSLVWAARLLLLSCIESKDLIDQAPDVSHDGLIPALEMLRKYAYVPIITSREFMSADHPRFEETMRLMTERKAKKR